MPFIVCTAAKVDIVSLVHPTKLVGLDLVREGGRHSIFQCGSTPIVVPRHVEINELTAKGITKDLEGELGSGWWQ